MAHFKLPSEDEYHRLGDVLAPKGVWNSLYPNDRAGLDTLTIRIQHGTRGKPAETKDERRITVKPSDKIPRFGIHLSYNDHHDVSVRQADLSPAEQVATIVDEQWEAAWRDAVRVFDSVLSAALGEAN